ncbi:MAG: FAD-dependent oxidoreductase, partial [Micrococcaceae bacterium]
MSSEQYDVIVIGAGIAGLTTATKAAESGAHVALVEKRDVIGGTSAMSGGWFAFCNTTEQEQAGIQDSRDCFREDLLAVGEHKNDPKLVDAYLDHQAETYAWLKEHGAVFRDVAISSGQSVARGHNTEIAALLQELHAAFTRAGGRTYFSARVQSLNTDPDGKVVGVTVDSARSSQELQASRGVVITTGGFTRSAELMEIFAPEQLNAIPFGGPENTGDGLRMAWKLGAGMADMSFISGTYGSHPETQDDFQELLTAYYLGAIVVNTEGKRFMDESQSYKVLGRHVLTQEQGLGFQVFDSAVRTQSLRGIPLKDMDTLEDRGHLHSADSLEELAFAAGIDAEGLIQTVNEYNRRVDAGEPDYLGRESLCNGIGKLVPIRAAPFYAYPAKSLMTTTYCGITVDPVGRVRTVDEKILPGLYAAGEVVGGFHGAAYMTGSSLGKGAVFGHLI